MGVLIIQGAGTKINAELEKASDEIKENEFSLAINRYVGHEIVNEDLEPADVMAAEWANHLETLHLAMQAVSSALEVETYE